jgi:hypothetical protein
MPIARLEQTVHQSCIKISTISIETETSFHLTHVTKEFHWVYPKWFPSLWYVRPKLCTKVAPRLTLSLNGPKQAFTWPVSPRSPIWSAQNDFWVYCTFSAQIVHLSCMEINTISKQSKTSFQLTHITKEVHWVRPKIFLWPWYIRRKPCTYLTLRLTPSPSKPKWSSTCPTTTRSSIGCTQNDF